MILVNSNERATMRDKSERKGNKIKKNLKKINKIGK